MSTRRIVVCDFCGKESMEGKNHYSEGWIMLWVNSSDPENDLNYDLCSYQCLIDKVMATPGASVSPVDKGYKNHNPILQESLYGELI